MNGSIEGLSDRKLKIRPDTTWSEYFLYLVEHEFA